MVQDSVDILRLVRESSVLGEARVGRSNGLCSSMTQTYISLGSLPHTFLLCVECGRCLELERVQVALTNSKVGWVQLPIINNHTTSPLAVHMRPAPNSHKGILIHYHYISVSENDVVLQYLSHWWLYPIV